MPVFTCPHNQSAHIDGKCVITECPYHMKKVRELFDVEEKDTGCSYFDSDIMQNVSPNRTQISALSRDPRRRFSPKLIRISYETALLYTKTLRELTHKVAKAKICCPRCGYPRQSPGKCVSTAACNGRKEWAKFICSQYQIEPTITKYQIIWELLLKNEIYTNDTTLKMGFALCYESDIKNNSKIPEKLLENTI